MAKRQSVFSAEAAEAKRKEFNDNLAKADVTQSTKESKRKVQICLSVDVDLKDRLKAYADARGVSISSLVAIWATEHGV